MNEFDDQLTQPPPPPGAGPTGNPWEQRDSLGIGTALVEALKLFITSPAEAFARTRRNGDFASPLIFAIVVTWIGIIIGQLWSLVFGGSILSMLPPQVRDQAGLWLAGSTGGMLFTIVLAPIWTTIGLFIWAGILHLSLTVVGGASQSKAGYEGTFRVVSYSTVSQLANLIPIVGGLVAAVWGIVLGVMGLTALHGTTQGKALAALLIPILVCCACVFGFVMTALGMAGMMAGQG